MAYRVVIAGAGPGGLAAAVSLKQSGFDPIILDRRATGDVLADVGGAYDLGREVIAVLRALGVEERARAIAMKWARLEVYDGALRPLRSLPMADLDVISLRRAELQQVLAEGLEIVGDAEVTGVRQAGDAVTIDLAGGGTLECDVLLGADGVHSAVRKAILSDGPPRYFGAMASWGTLPADHPAVAQFPRDAGQMFMGVPASAMAGTVHDRYVWSVLWPTPEFQRAEGASARKQVVLETARAAVPAFAPVVEATEAEHIAVVGIWDRDPAPRWSAGRVVLLGDAAHPTSPTLGQGAQSAIVDGFVLGRLLGRHAPAEASRRYEERRMKLVNENVLSARRMGKLLFSGNGAVQWLNRAFFRWVPAGYLLRGVESANRANDVSDLVDSP